MLHLTVKNGPDHFGLIVSEHHGDSKNRNEVRFVVSDLVSSVVVTVVINRNEREDGSGLNFLFRGYIVSAVPQAADNREEAYELCKHIKGNFEAFYTLRDRTGWFKVVDPNADTPEKVLRDLIQQLAESARKNGTFEHVLSHGELELSPLEGRVWRRALDVLRLDEDWKRYNPFPYK